VFLLLVWFAPLIIFDIDLTLGGVVSKRWRLCSEWTAVWKVSGKPLEIKKSYFVVFEVLVDEFLSYSCFSFNAGRAHNIVVAERVVLNFM